jgi:hypothetical protein
VSIVKSRMIISNRKSAGRFHPKIWRLIEIVG